MGHSFFEEWKEKLFTFVEYIFFAPDEGSYCWIAIGGVQN